MATRQLHWVWEFLYLFCWTVRPDIFLFFIFQESQLYFFKKWKKILKFRFLFCRPYENLPNLKKPETNWVRNYILLCKKAFNPNVDYTCIYIFQYCCNNMFCRNGTMLVCTFFLSCSVICKTSRTIAKILFFRLFVSFASWYENICI